MVRIKVEHHGESTMVVVLSGRFPEASRANEIVKIWKGIIDKHAVNTNFPNLNVVFNMSDLVFTKGDVLAWLWIWLMHKGAECVVVASGDTKKNLSDMMRHTKSVALCESLEDALINVQVSA
jgi:hypothetical protein